MDKKRMIWLAAAFGVLAVVDGALSLSNKRVEEKEKAEEEAQVIQVADLGEIVSFSYSAPEQETLHFEKTDATQRFSITPRTVTKLTLHSLIKADDPSPFPALSQFEAWGKEAAADGKASS